MNTRFNAFSSPLNRKWAMLAIAGIVAVWIVIMCYGYANDLRNEGIAQEQQLSAQYLSNQNWLSTYISAFYEKVGLAQAQSATFDNILQNAVKGRYDKEGFGTGSPLFAAILEAYPDQSSLMMSWNNIQDYITSGREGYRNQQDKLLSQLQTYDTWRKTGFIKSTVVRILGFPTDGLEARVGEVTYQGNAARDKMYAIVLTQSAVEAYETSRIAPLQVPIPTKSQ